MIRSGRGLPTGQRFLVVRLSALGDVLMTLPLVRALRERFPRATIDFATQAEFVPLLEGHPDLDRVVPIPVRAVKRGLSRPWRWPEAWGVASRLAARLRGGRYDVILDAHGNLKSGLVTRWTGAPVRIGPSRPESKEANSWFMTAQPRPPATPLRHRRDRALSLLSVLGVPAGDTGCRLPEYPQTFASAVLKGVEGRRVLLHPGTSPKAAFKRWPAAHFGALARDLADRGATPLVVGGPGEEALVAEVVATSLGSAQALPVPPGLPALGGLLGAVDVYVGADSGPAQLAHALGTPAVVLFGPKNPALYGPRGHGVAVVNPVACQPCGKRRCPLQRVECLEDLSPATVAAACHLMLEGGRTPGQKALGDVRVVRQR